MNDTFRILVLGDFGGRDHRGLSDVASLKSRRARRVDRDDLDSAIAAIAPEIHLATEPGAEPIVVRVRELEDFHPDRLLERVADFQRLRELKAHAADADRASPRPAAPARAPSVDEAAVDLTTGSVLDLILDADSTGNRPIIAPRDDLSKFVARAVQDHVVKPRNVDQQTLIDQIDDVIMATMRVVLHHRNFQSAESVWGGLAFLTRHLDTDENLQVYCADVTRSELDAAATSPSGDAGRGLATLLRGEGPGGHGGWSLVVGAYSFEPSDVAIVASVAALASKAGVPWVSGADSRVAGADSFRGNADPDDWNVAEIAGWDAFRRDAAAKSIALALPRFLLRVPYGKKTNECSDIAFEETDDGALPHEHYLWGNPAFVVARLCGEASAAGDDPPTHGTMSGFPLFVEKIDGLPDILPVAEAFLGGRAVMLLLDRGLTVLASERDGDSIRVPRLQSCSLPAAPLTRPVSTEAR